MFHSCPLSKSVSCFLPLLLSIGCFSLFLPASPTSPLKGLVCFYIHTNKPHFYLYITSEFRCPVEAYESSDDNSVFPGEVIRLAQGGSGDYLVQPDSGWAGDWGVQLTWDDHVCTGILCGQLELWEDWQGW